MIELLLVTASERMHTERLKLQLAVSWGAGGGADLATGPAALQLYARS